MGLAAFVLLAAAFAGAASSNRYTGRNVQGVDLVVEGGDLPGVADQLVEVRVGQPYDPVTVRRSIKQLFALGTFSDVKVEAEPERDGVHLTFHLYPVATVREVRLESTGGDPEIVHGIREDLLAEAGIDTGRLPEAEQVEEAGRRIAERMKREGFLWSRVEPELRFQNGGVDVVFHVDTGPQARVSELRVDGVASHIERHIRRKAALKAGSVYVPRSLESRMEELVNQWKGRRYYEARISIREEPDPSASPGSVRVTIEAETGPQVRVQVTGAKLSARALDGLIPIPREKSISEDLVEESRANLEEYFRDRGYPQCAVDVLRSTSGGRAVLLLTFRVERGPRVEVGDVRVEGLSSLSPGEMETILAIRRRRGQFFRRREWEDDLDELRSFLRQRGFHRSAVHGEVVERGDSAEPDVVDLVVRVDEGPRASIEAVDIDGADRLPSNKVLAASGLEVGSPFDATEIARARDRLVSLYRNRGFRQARVDVRTVLDETGSRASVGFVIDEGMETLVDQVILAGLVTTRKEALHREVTLVPKQPLSAGSLNDTRQRLVGTGLFRDVQVEVLPRDPSSRASDVLIRLEEGPRTSFGYGFGYNERELARAEVELTRRNLFGLNRSASIFGRASVRGHRLIATYRQPEFLGLRVPVVVTAFSEEEDRKSFDYTRLGAGLSISKELSVNSTLLLRYNYQRTHVFGLEIDPEELPRAFRNERLSTVSVAGVTDTRDDPISPSRGQFRILDFQLSARLLGSHAPYVKGLAQQFLYYPLPGRMVAAIGLRLGIAQSFREEFDALIPITERFFAGGANTLRGFGLDQASPKTMGEPKGGNVLSILNLELRFPITGHLGGVVFSDNGNVYRRLKQIEALNWRYNMGLGFRYETPLGPLRVDYGFKLDRREDEPPGRLHVSLGHAF